MLFLYLLVLDCFGAYVNFMIPFRLLGILLFYYFTLLSLGIIWLAWLRGLCVFSYCLFLGCLDL